MRWFTFSTSRTASGLSPVSRASTSQSISPGRSSASVAGAVTSHHTWRAAWAGTCTTCGSNVSSAARGATCTVIGRWMVLRTVKPAWKRSPVRTSGGRPLISCRSCAVRMCVWPVPKYEMPLSATATTRNVVSASLSGTVTRALPCASSCTFGCHSSSVSSSSRTAPPARAAVVPSPPGGSALRP